MAKRTSLTELMQQTNAAAVKRAGEQSAKRAEKRKPEAQTSQADDVVRNNKLKKVVEPKAEPKTLESGGEKNEIVKATIYLPLQVFDQLRSLHFDEQRGRAKRIKMHDYFLESLDLLFKQRGLKSISELTKKD